MQGLHYASNNRDCDDSIKYIPIPRKDYLTIKLQLGKADSGTPKLGEAHIG